MFAKKGLKRTDGSKQQIPIGDYDIDSMIEKVFKRQHKAQLEHKRNVMSMSYYKASQDSRHEHSLQRYSQMLSHWRKHNMHIERQLQRSFKDSVAARVDSYRRTKEIIDKLDSDKPQSETLNSSYAFKASLRSERKSVNKAKQRLASRSNSIQAGLHSQHSNSRAHNDSQDYGSPVLNKNKSVRFEVDEHKHSDARLPNKSVSFDMQDRKR